ncbi:hypothetical protein [Bdellovibrio sp. NC01]|uniref:hypothetical protein n=1 Tax=Bdellovibrio sp. NC01 TaxID=2220073 RepID=UPI001158587F|nr:hypothetical protein [Bdellovibrio sp. NC01]QDK37477.1 hypothetical protein DOE51_07720 [Bdellovibrio sp. NC01]
MKTFIMALASLVLTQISFAATDSGRGQPSPNAPMSDTNLHPSDRDYHGTYNKKQNQKRTARTTYDHDEVPAAKPVGNTKDENVKGPHTDY